MRNLLDKLNEEIEELYMNYNFQLDDIDYDSFTIALSTRENGNVGDEEYSDIDFENAEKICDEILTDYSDGFDGKTIDCQIDTCDEWVHLDISLF